MPPEAPPAPLSPTRPWVVCATLVAGATALASALDAHVSLTSLAMVYLLAVVAAAYLLDWVPAVATAVAAVTALKPFERRQDLLAAGSEVPVTRRITSQDVTRWPRGRDRAAEEPQHLTDLLPQVRVRHFKRRELLQCIRDGTLLSVQQAPESLGEHEARQVSGEECDQVEEDLQGAGSFGDGRGCDVLCALDRPADGDHVQDIAPQGSLKVVIVEHERGSERLPWLVTGDGPGVLHVVDDLVEVLVGEGVADEEHVTGEQHGLDQPEEGGMARRRAEVVIPGQHDPISVGCDAAVELQQPPLSWPVD